jgi:manganese/zinc/iron transport system substrate-binding protein
LYPILSKKYATIKSIDSFEGFRMKKLFVIIIFFVLIILGFFGFFFIKKPYFLVSGKISIVTTTGIIADTVKEIAGDHAQVYALMGPGVDPHIYHARESDVQRFAGADIIFYNGLHLEGKMGQILEQMASRVPTYAVSAVLQPHELRASGFEGLYDPHIWFDLKLWMKVVEGIRDVLVRHDPLHEREYRMNAERFLIKLAQLDEYIRKRIAEIPEESRILITAHDAFSYFGQTYGMTIISLQGISTDSEVGVHDVNRVVNYIVEHNIPAIFAEASLPRRTIDAVVQAVEVRGKRVILGEELYSDTLGEPGTIQERYLGMVRLVVDRIVEALTRKST